MKRIGSLSFVTKRCAYSASSEGNALQNGYKRSSLIRTGFMAFQSRLAHSTSGSRHTSVPSSVEGAQHIILSHHNKSRHSVYDTCTL